MSGVVPLGVKKPHLLIPGNSAVAEHYRTWIREIESRHECASDGTARPRV